MQFERRRHHNASLLGITYYFDVRFDCTDEERRVIDTHGFARNPIYTDPTKQEHADRAAGAFARTREHNVFQNTGARNFCCDLVTGLLSWISAKSAYQVTVADALSGTTITCSDITALLACEEEVTSAFDELARLVDDALSFEFAELRVLVPEHTDTNELPAPATLANPNQGY